MQDTNENVPEELDITGTSENDESLSQSKTAISEDLKTKEDLPSETVNEIINDIASEKIIDSKSTLTNENIYSELVLIKEGLAGLNDQFDSKLKYDSHKNQQIDNLHKEVQEYKTDLLRKLLKPLIDSLIKMLDDYYSLYRSYEAKDITEIDISKLVKQLSSVYQDVEDVLDIVGVTTYSTDDIVFDSTKHQVVKSVTTEDAEKDKFIVERLKKGVYWDFKVYRPEQVVCFKKIVLNKI